MPTEASRIANTVPPEPWRSFLKDLDSQLKDVVVLRCLGGFVVTQQYGIGRGTSDIDFLSVSAISAEDNLESLGGLGSALHKSIAYMFSTSALRRRLMITLIGCR